jgi:ATP-binding cassette subfamily B protein
VLDNGEVAESGSHAELMQKSGLYSRMYEEYTRSVDWKVNA